MTEDEFDLIDELYFVISYQELKSQIGWEENQLNQILKSLFDRGWVRLFEDPDGTSDCEEWPDKLDGLFYLASKAGLKAHNS